MNNTQRLLTDAQKRVPRQSKNHLADMIKTHRSTMRRLLNGKGYPNAQQCIELAKLLELPVETVIEQVTEDKKKARSKAPTIVGMIGVMLAAGMVLAINTSPATAASNPYIYISNKKTLYSSVSAWRFGRFAFDPDCVRCAFEPLIFNGNWAVLTVQRWRRMKGTRSVLDSVCSAVDRACLRRGSTTADRLNDVCQRGFKIDELHAGAKL